MRLEIDDAKTETQEQYEPLWAQIQKNFKLRDGDVKQDLHFGANRELTKPKSPTLQTLERMKLKGDIQIASADKIYENKFMSEFKAMPFNRKAFENPFVPKIDKKS